MAQTGTQWSGQSGHLKVGVNVRWDDIGPSTTQTHVYTDWYVQSQGWGYSDPQRLNFNYSLGGYFDYTMSSPSGGTVTVFVGTYDIGVQAVNYGGSGAWNFGGYVSGAYDGSAPSIVYYWAVPPRPPSAPSAPGLGVDSVTNSSARIVVSAAADNGSGIDWYGAWVTTNNAPPGGGGNVVASASGGTFTASGLSPATNYYAWAQAHNGVNYGPMAGPVGFTTGATVPSAVGALTASAISVTTATLSWAAPYNGGSGITSYQVQTASDAAFTVDLQTFTVSATSANLTGLKPGSANSVRVRAINGVGPGAWSATGTINTLPGTPVITSPTSGATRSDSRFDVTFTLQGAKSDTTVTVQFSQDSTFATGVQNVSGNASAYLVSGTTYRVIGYNTAYYLKTGTWYVRVQSATPSSSYTSPWTAAVQFTQAHTPSATLSSPTTGAMVKYAANTAFTWAFLDPAVASGWIEGQSAYRLVIENNGDGSSVYDSGKVTSAATSQSVAIGTGLKNTVLRWRVMVWDHGDTPSAWTGYATFTLSDPPTVAFISPASGLAVDNGSPAFSWSFSAPSTGTQATAVLTVIDTATNTQVWSKSITGTATSAQPDAVILLNTHSYLATVTVTDTYGLSSTASVNFSASYVAPDPVAYNSIDSSHADDLGYVLIDWTDANPDTQFISWKVYRKQYGDDAWSLLAVITDQNTRQYTDYMLIAGSTYMYSVTQTANRSGSELESAVGYRSIPNGSGGFTSQQETRSFTVDLTYYWIINPDNLPSSLLLTGVTNDDSTLEFEQSTYTIIGRGRHVDYGDELGYSGQLNIQVRTTDRQSMIRTKIEALRRAQETYYLRTPFGRLFEVALGNIGWSPRPGVGTSEMGDMTVPYMEVS